MVARVRLERPTTRAAAEFIAAAARSAKLHAPWVAAPRTQSAYRAYVKTARTPAHVGYLIRRRGSEELVGVANISEIVRASFRSAYLGYYAFAPYDDQGLMREGLGLVIAHAFRRLRLHAHLAAGGGWRTDAVLRLASADRTRILLALAPKLAELPAPASALGLPRLH